MTVVYFFLMPRSRNDCGYFDNYEIEHGEVGSRYVVGTEPAVSVSPLRLDCLLPDVLSEAAVPIYDV